MPLLFMGVLCASLVCMCICVCVPTVNNMLSLATGCTWEQGAAAISSVLGCHILPSLRIFCKVSIIRCI